jgi:hypothetical protein
MYVRSGIRTHAHRSGLRPERSALDLSAILTLQLPWANRFWQHLPSFVISRVSWYSEGSLSSPGPLAQLVRASC